MNSALRYLRKIGHSWYVRIKVPPKLREVVGNTHIVRALRTRDLDEANRLKWAKVEEIKAHLERLKRTDPLNLEAQSLRSSIRQAREKDDLDAVEALESVATDRAEDIYKTTGNLNRAKEWVELATSDTPTLSELIEIWLAHSEYLEQTKKQHKKAFEEFKEFVGGDFLPSKVTDDIAISYVEDHLKKSKQSYSTKRRKLNSLSAFWEWLILRKHVPRGSNPWKGFKLSKRKAVRTTLSKRDYTEEELIKLFSGNPKTKGLPELMILGLYTGARINEICSLNLEDIQQNGGGIFFLNIIDSKTPAGVRNIAVAHPLACSILSKRWKPDTKGQLFPEFKPGGYDRKLSWNMSKAFGRYRDKMKLSRATDFHSFRRTVATLMENLGLDQMKQARHMGHKLGTLAFDIYSGGSSVKTKIEVAKKIRYSEDVEKAVLDFYKRTITNKRE